MIELRHTSTTTAELGVAGDTYNTAVSLARVSAALRTPLEVAYLTGLGTDPYSEQIRRSWAGESVADASVRVPERTAGLYAVRTDAAGERSFTYWRNDSAAAALFRGTRWIDAVDADLVHFSGISLQLMSRESREAFLDRLAEIRRRGGVVSFDTNFRPAGWATADSEPREAFDDAGRYVDVVFVSRDDERLLVGREDADAIAAHYRRLGASEVIVKLGAEGAAVVAGARRHNVSPGPQVRVVDTTGAGDALAGGYLAARLAGREPVAAATLGVAVATDVIGCPGAITPRKAFTLPKTARLPST